MNYFDIAVIVIILGLGIIGYVRGFVRTCLGFLPSVAAIFGAYVTYPHLSKFLRGTFVYEKIMKAVQSRLSFQGAVSGVAQSDIFNSLNAPSFIKEALINNNNSVVYDILDVSGVEEYISGFIANVSVNILSVVIAFIGIFIVAKLIIRTLDFAADLPVLSFFNKSCGLALGLVKGVVFVWLIGIVLTFFYYNESFSDVVAMLNASKIALFMYENNYLLFMILKIIA